MHKRKPIIKLSLIGIAIILGLLLAFVPVKIGLKDYNSFVGNIKLGIDLKGGVYAVYDVVDGEDDTDLDSRLDGTVARLTKILTEKNYPDATVVREGSTKIRVDVPDVDDPQTLFSIIGNPAELRFEAEDGSTILTGDEVIKANPISNYQGSPAVELSLNSTGASAFAKATSAENNGKTIKIIVTTTNAAGEREENVVSQATINEQITGGKAIISGSFDYDGAKELADQIMSGAFEVKLSLKVSEIVSPQLGADALKYGLIAGGIGIFLILVYMAVLYRGMGLAADLSLIIYVILMLFALQAIPLVQLTLPGIAGIILSIGMAVDSNIVIFERIKEENRAGKQITTSIYGGFKRALAPVIDANITTIIAGVSLLIFGTGSIQGFAVTLLLGIVIALFTTLIMTKIILKQFIQLNDKNAKFYSLIEPSSATESGTETKILLETAEVTTNE